MFEPERRAWSRLLDRLRRDRRGAIAPLAAVVITAGLITSFSAIDIGRLVTAHAQLQDAIDAANLALARMPPSTTDAQMQAKAQAWINANITDVDIQDLVVATPVRSAGVIKLTVTADMKTTVASFVGVQQVPLSGTSTVKYGTTKVELVLVLDNTGSMNDDSKLTSLKAAAKSLIDTLNASAQASGLTDALKVGVVPFSMAVNVGSTYQNASWLTGSMPSAYGSSGDAVDPGHPNRFTLLSKMGVSWGGCVEDRPMPYDVQETAPDASNPATMFVPYFAPDEPDPGYYYLPTYGVAPYSYSSISDGNSDGWSKSFTYGKNHYYLYSENNYLKDTVSDNYGDQSKGGSWINHQNNSPTSKYTTKPQSGTSAVWGNAIGPNAGCTVQALQRLTTNVSTVESQIAGMTAGGDTEIPLGLVWGWHLISPNLPFADGQPYGTAGVLKVIVLVTDGANTYGGSQISPSQGYVGSLNQSHYTALGYANSQRITSATDAPSVANALDSRLQTLCSNMKQKNADGSWKINIYTVPLEVTDTGIKSLLQGCVTDPANYLDTTSSSQLAQTFTNIAGSISALRVSH